MRRVVSVCLATFAAAGVLSCSSGDGAGTSKSSLSRVEARGDIADVLLAQGGKLVADYGAFKLIDIAPSAVAGLPPEKVTARKDSFVIGLNAGEIDTSTENARALRGIALPKSGRALHLVQFAGPIQPKWHEALAATGVKIVAYIPANAYLVYGDAAAFQALQGLASEPFIQWDGAYLPNYKINPSVYDPSVKAEGYQVQLVEDKDANPETLASIGGEGVLSPAGIDHSLGYTNFVAMVSKELALGLADRPDVVSIYPWSTPIKLDERQDRIISGFLDATGAQPTSPGYLPWLESKGFGPATFGFGVDVSDDGLDNATLNPNNFALHELGMATAPGRVMYARCEGSCTELRGCDGHGNLNSHIVGGYVGSTRTGPAFRDAAGYAYGLGVAPFVRLGSSVIFGPSWSNPDYEDLQSRAYNDGARISSNSWGYTSGNTYTADSQRYDALVRDAQPAGSAVPAPGNQQMTIVFAAGNSGPGANTIHPPSTGKNVFVSGAAENYHPFGGTDGCGVTDSDANSAMDMAFFSSRGPTSDGRKKPDLSAPGTHVSGGVFQTTGQNAEPPGNSNGQADSCFTGNSVCGGTSSIFWPGNGVQWTTASSGTSHSTPAMAGASALVRQWYLMQGNPDPSPAVIKATMMGTAHYMNGVGANDNLPSSNQGMGETDLGMAFDTTPKMVRDQDPLDVFTATGETRVFTGSIGDTTKPFRVTLAWTDAPGNTTGNAWNNDLDLTVTVGGNTYYGNAFSGGLSVTGGAADFRNNVESVFLPAGTSGSFTITITAANINSDGIPNVGGPLDQDFALFVYNACDQAPATPTNLTATVAGPNRIDLAWDDVGAPTYSIYRSFTPGGPYSLIAVTGATTLSDTTVSGGSTYYYVVRGKICAESPDSNEASATATGDCTLPPAFTGVQTVTNAMQSTCTIDLSWTAATPYCGGALTYNVYRSRTPGFTPSIANRIATGVAGTTFTDTANLTQGTPYYYVVRAVETGAQAVEEQNAIEKSTSPTGTIVQAINYFDDFDGVRPPNAAAYWIESGTPDELSIVSTCHWQSSSNSYKFGAPGVCGSAYPNSQISTLSLGGNGTVDPAINGFAFPSGGTAQMTFRHWFSMESGWDGARLMYSTTGPSGPWTYVDDVYSSAAPYISSGGYTGSASSAGTRVWTGSSAGANGAERSVTVNLDALAGQTAWFAFNFTTDSSVTYEGHYLDDMAITADQVGTCSSGVIPPGPAVSYAIDLPASAQAGVSTPFTVTAHDAWEQVAVGYFGAAAVSVTDPQGVVSTPITFANGVSSGAVIFGTMGNQSLTAADTADPSVRGTASTTVIPGPPAALAIQTQPTQTTAGSPISPPVQVRIVDQFGNFVNTATDPVTIALGNNPGAGTLSGTLTVNAAGGVATFFDLSIDKAGAGYTLIATSGALTSATTDAFDIIPGPPAMLGIITEPSTAQAGVAIAPPIEIGVYDLYGNLTNAATDVSVYIDNNPGGSWLMGTTYTTTVNGVATFNDLALTRVGAGYTLVFGNWTLAPVVSNPFDIIPGDPYGLVVTTEPTDSMAGVPFSPTVTGEVWDYWGNLATQYNGPVDATLLGGAGGHLLGPTTVNANAGVAAFPGLAVDKVGNGYTLGLTASGMYMGISRGFDITAGAPAALAFVGQPSNVQAGAAMSPPVRVAVQDAYGNATASTAAITLELSYNPGGGTLGGTLTVNAVGGVATFPDLTVNRVAFGYMLRATASGLSAAVSGNFEVFAGPAASLVYTVQPSNAVAGALISPFIQVRAFDAQGNVATGFSGSVTLALSSNPGGATVTGETTASASNGGVSFFLALDKAGTGYRFNATSGALPSVESNAFDISPAATSRLVFGAQPQNGTAGTALAPVQVRAEDSFGNATPAFAGTVRLALEANSHGAALEGTLQQAAVAGVATFADLRVNTAGTGYAMDASSTGLPTISSSTFDIAAGAPASLIFVGQPSRVQAGVAMSPAVLVALLDAYGNATPAATNAITLALDQNPGGGTLFGTLTVNASGGIATFADIGVNRTGSGYTLRATGSGLSAAVSGPFDVFPSAASRLEYTVQPASARAGEPINSMQVRALDWLGNVATDFSGSVGLVLSSNPGGATVSGDTSVHAVNGVATFSGLSLDKVGAPYRFEAMSGLLSSVVSNSFTIMPADTSRLVFSAQPQDGVAGTALVAVRVRAEDRFGNATPTFTGTVRLALEANSTGAVLAGTLSQAAVAGVATFTNLTVNKAGTGYAIDASSTGLPTTSSNTFDIAAGAPATLAFVGQPSNVQAGAAMSPAVLVALFDAYGNATPTATNAVTLALAQNPGTGTLGGTLTVNASGGIASFADLTVDRVASGYALRATGSGLTAAVSNAFSVSPGPAAALEYTVQPSNAVAGEPIAPSIQVRALDAEGNVATGFSGSVTLALSSNPGGATVSGDTSVSAVNGVALFSGLSLDKVGAGYRFTASSGALPSIPSNAFDISAAATSRLVFSAQPQNGTAGTALNAVQVSAQDRFGNATPSFTGTVRLALEANSTGAVLAGTLSQAAVAGVATFADLTVNKAGTGYAMAASSTGLPTISSTTFDIVAGAPSALVYLTEPADAQAGAPISPALLVGVLDAYGNLTSSTMNVTMALDLNPGGGALSGTTTRAASGGVATFADLSIDKAGVGYTLQASGSGVSSATSRGFSITDGAASSLEFIAQPSDGTAGAPIYPTVKVRVRDAYGNTNTRYSGAVTVTLAANPSGATLGGDTSVNAVGGIASFTGLTLNKVGTGYTLAAEAGALAGATSQAFDIGPAAAASLRFRVEPSNVVAGADIAPAVKVEALDAYGNPATGFTGTVRLALEANAHNAVLAGTMSANAAAGVASFASLNVATAGNGYTLVANASGLSPASSAAFDVSAGPPARYVLVGMPASVTVGVQVTFSVRALDASGNLSTGYAGTATVSSTSALTRPASVSFAFGEALDVPVTFHTTGIHTLTVTDSADAALTATANVTATAFPQPTVRITDPASGAEVTGLVAITADGTVATGTTLTNISVLVDGIEVGNGATFPFNATWDSKGAEPGSAHQITAVISDAAGNVVQAVPVTVTIAKTGCGCGAVSGGEGSLLFGLAVAMQLIRRRRRAK